MQELYALAMIVGVLLYAGWVLTRARRRHKRLDDWKRQVLAELPAEELPHVIDEDSIGALIAGRRVELRWTSKADEPLARIEARAELGMPILMDADLLRTLHRDVVRRVVPDLALYLSEIEIRDGQLCLARSWQGTARPQLVEVSALARAVEDEAIRPWKELARKRGLVLTALPGITPCADGRVKGVQVEVLGRAHPRVPVWIRAPIPAPLPDGFSVREKGRGMHTGDAILDRALRIEARDPSAARRLLGTRHQDPLREALLDVVRGRPGSTVEGGSVLLACPNEERLVEDLDAAVELALLLARAVREA